MHLPLALPVANRLPKHWGMCGNASFATAPIGRLRHGSRERLARHCHDTAFAALVLSGEYQEAGDEGRSLVRAGDVLIHHAYESHLDRVSAAGAEVLVLPVPAALADAERVRGRVGDPDRIVRAAECDPRVAAAMLADAFMPVEVAALDWPDLLAEELRIAGSIALAEWADRHRLRPDTVSRGFRQAYGCAPRQYRAAVRTRLALRAITGTREPLAEIALNTGFADQAHMTRAIGAMTGQTPRTWRAANWVQDGVARG